MMTIDFTIPELEIIETALYDQRSKLINEKLHMTIERFAYNVAQNFSEYAKEESLKRRKLDELIARHDKIITKIRNEVE